MYFAAYHETRNDNELSAIYDIKALEEFLILVLVFRSIQTLSHPKDSKTTISRLDQNCCGSDLFFFAFGCHRELWDKSEAEPALVSEDTHYLCSETVTVEFERMRKIRLRTKTFWFKIWFSSRTSRV